VSSAVKIIKWLLKYPVALFVLFYIYWLVTIPTGMIIWGLVLLGAYLVMVILERFANNDLFLFITVAIAFLLAVPATIYILLAISLLADYGIENITSGFVLLIGSVVIVASAYRKFLSRNMLGRKIAFICMFPLMLLNVLFFSIYYPTIKDTVFFQGDRYHIIDEMYDDVHSHQAFYRCNWFGFYCKSLYSSHGYRDAKFIIDNPHNEISLFENYGLRYTYGLQSRYYEGFPVESGDQIYELGWYCDEVSASAGEQVDYVLYQCNLDYTGCKPLPIKYISYYDDYYLDLGKSENAEEIRLFDNSNDPPDLIFTWGEHPRCYVEDCEILEKK
jgi:hypothetical protein